MFRFLLMSRHKKMDQVNFSFHPIRKFNFYLKLKCITCAAYHNSRKAYERLHTKILHVNIQVASVFYFNKAVISDLMTGVAAVDHIGVRL